MTRMTHFQASSVQSLTEHIYQKAIQLFVWLSVENNGKGIGPKNYVFNFYQCASASGTYLYE